MTLLIGMICALSLIAYVTLLVSDYMDTAAKGGSMITGGCIKCKKCEQIRMHFYCGRKRLTEKQVYNKNGYCSRFEPKKPPKEE